MVWLMARDPKGLVNDWLVGEDAPRLDAARGRHHGDGLRVVDAGGEFGGGETAEHHRVDRPEAGAREHRDDGLRNHGHVHDDAVALRHAQIGQAARKCLHLGEQIRVADRPLRAGERTVVDDGDPIAVPGQHVPVNGVEARVE